MSGCSLLQKYARILRREYPDTKFAMRCKKLDGKIHGYVTKHGDSFTIFIDSRLTCAHSLDILTHEFAHALAWDDNHESGHGDEWAIAYGNVYNTFLQHMTENEASDD